jgi:hypothetical protein
MSCEAGPFNGAIIPPPPPIHHGQRREQVGRGEEEKNTLEKKFEKLKS